MADHRLGFRTFEEETGSIPLDVAGDLPDWLSGTLYRNGPGRFEVGDRTLVHWFDGLALLRRFEFGEGEITYGSRFLESDAYRAAREGSLRYPEFGTLPERSILGRMRDLFGGTLTDNASITVRHREGEHRAVTETASEIAFDPGRLSTLDHRRIDVPATGTLAHDHYDFVQEEWVGLGVRFGRNPGYVLYRDPDDGPVEVVAEVDHPEVTYVHSFALTDHYAIVTEHPFVASPRRFLADRPFAESLRWYPGRDTRFLVIDRRTGEVTVEPRVPPFFTFHHVDAHERGDELFVDLVAFEDHSIVPALALSNLRSREPDVPTGELRRYTGSTSKKAAPSDERSSTGRSSFLPPTTPKRTCISTGSVTASAGIRGASTTASGRSTSNTGASRSGMRSRSTPAKRCSSPAPTGNARTTASSCRLRSTPRRSAPVCCFSTRSSSRSAPGRTCPTRFRSTSTGPSTRTANHRGRR